MHGQIMDLGQKVAQSRGHMLIIGLYREIINKYFYLKTRDLEL